MAKAKAVAMRVSGRRPDVDAMRMSQEVLRHLPSGIVFFDRHGRVEEANPAARAALGYGNPQGMTLAQLFRDAELCEPDGQSLGPAAPLMQDTYRSSRILQRKTMRYSTPGGQGRRLGVTLFPLRNETGAPGTEMAPAGLICLLTDLTAIHALEEELQRRKNLGALGEMAAGIAHEFKNGLATISGYGQMLQASLSQAPELAEERLQAQKILQQAAMLNNIATEFLTFARPLSVQPEPLDLTALLRRCAEAIQVQDFPQIEISIDLSFPWVAGDIGLLTAAAINLMRNACEAIAHTGAPGRVEVVCDGVHEGQVRILFRDSGPGVPPEVAEKIFIPFFTTKASGTGLGLSMVHKIITAHRGSVLLADASAGHTVFAVLLPVVARES
ncbi:MAG TPA: ATP-binding protein [Terriglobales bacterium]|nr:ATP-binding protein [Terriglobales bacterium]